ncbi:MAG: DNA repair photolyase [Spirochaetales bacterium]|nr:DNA repair photolyase [Spirochaetales bacterium]
MTKITEFQENTNWLRLGIENRSFIESNSLLYNFSHQDIKQLIDIALDLQSWGEKPLSFYLPKEIRTNLKDKELKKYIINTIKDAWLALKANPTDYTNFVPNRDIEKENLIYEDTGKDRVILGDCPVASEKTRCCNLKTLDSVINCGFDCSYCTIQSFYRGGKILFEKNLKNKLQNINLDKNKKYHIGTGQSSDSLMWGNYNNNLEDLFNFAIENTNIILELKTKSANIDYLLKTTVPKNVICTWSINPDIIIQNEEHLTASLNERLDAAKKVHDKGILVGFHFHPMVHYSNWENDYKEIANKIMSSFDPQKVALISIGTLTFIKPVIKQIRNRNFKTKILQMPLVDAEGKFSYPYNIKKEMFSTLYSYFKDWHTKVFFYMCMEDKKLWMDVFNREYQTNEDFELDMITNYFTKIED